MHRLRVGLGLLCFGSICSFSQVSSAQTSSTEPTRQELQQQIQELREEVKDLRANVNHAPATQPVVGEDEHQVPSRDRAAYDTASYQKSMTGSSPFGNLTAGYARDKGFYIRSEDGNFLLHPWAFVQARDAFNYRSHGKGMDGDAENGFEIPRMKLVLDGNVFSPDLTYQVIWATNDTSGNLQLQDAWARYHIPRSPFAVEAGQIRNPLDHEQITFATKSLTPDRSIVNNILLNGDDVVKGASLSYGYDTPSPFRVLGAITSGQRNFDTNFQGYPTNPANWGTAIRADWKLMGNWSDYNQFTSLGNKEPLFVIGAGADYTEAGAAAALTHVVDAQFTLPQGLTLYGAYLGRYTRHDAGLPNTNGTPASSTSVASDTYDSTVRLMVAQLFNDRFEPFARYEYIQFDPHEFTAGTKSTVHDITAGFNYYFYGHRAKITTGATYLPNGCPVGNTISDLLATKHGNEWILQAQFQLIL